MPMMTGVQGYTSLTQQTRLCIETTTPAGEQLLLPLIVGAGSMTLTTQPNTLSPTTGMHLHGFVFGNAMTGSLVIVGTNAVGGAQTSITYHIPIAPQQAQGYTEFTTKESWATVTSITATGLTTFQMMVWGSFAAKFLLPITITKDEKIPKESPDDKRGILFKNFRVVQLTKSVDVSKLDCTLYPGALWPYYMAIGPNPAVVTIPATPTVLLAATAKAATMPTLTTPPVNPGMFLVFTVSASNILAGTISIIGLNNFGAAATETITVPASGPVTLYSSNRYSAITSITTTGLTTAVTIAIAGVYGWTFTWTYDGVTNLTPYSGTIEAYDGIEGIVLPGVILTSLDLNWEKEKAIMLAAKAEAQDYCIVGDPTSLAVGANPFAALPQPMDLPYVSWPSSFYIDNGSATPFTSQDGTFLSYKLGITTGRKWMYVGDGQQRPSYVTWDKYPDYSIDATIVGVNYQNYQTYFKTNASILLGTQFQGNWLGMIGTTNYYESVAITAPCKIESWEMDQAKNPIEGKLKLMSEYNPAQGFGYKVAVTCQTPPTYLN